MPCLALSLTVELLALTLPALMHMLGATSALYHLLACPPHYTTHPLRHAACTTLLPLRLTAPHTAGIRTHCTPHCGWHFMPLLPTVPSHYTHTCMTACCLHGGGRKKKKKKAKRSTSEQKVGCSRRRGCRGWHGGMRAGAFHNRATALPYVINLGGDCARRLLPY